MLNESDLPYDSLMSSSIRPSRDDVTKYECEYEPEPRMMNKRSVPLSHEGTVLDRQDR